MFQLRLTQRPRVPYTALWGACHKTLRQTLTADTVTIGVHLNHQLWYHSRLYHSRHTNLLRHQPSKFASPGICSQIAILQVQSCQFASLDQYSLYISAIMFVGSLLTTPLDQLKPPTWTCAFSLGSPRKSLKQKHHNSSLLPIPSKINKSASNAS